MEWIDTHAHLYAKDFEGRISEVVRKAREASVSRIITIGVNGQTNPRCIGYAEEHEEIFAAVGWQPTDLDELGEEMELSAEQIATLRGQASHPKAVAIGEIGLDYFRLPRTETPEVLRIKERQKRVFVQQLELAAELGLPCAIHQRGDGTFEDCLELFKPFAGRLRAVFHCFVSDLQAAQAFFELGCLISVTGIVTFKKAEELRETIPLPATGKNHGRNRRPLPGPRTVFPQTLRACPCRLYRQENRGNTRAGAGRVRGNLLTYGARIFLENEVTLSPGRPGHYGERPGESVAAIPLERGSIELRAA